MASEKNPCSFLRYTKISGVGGGGAGKQAERTIISPRARAGEFLLAEKMPGRTHSIIGDGCPNSWLKLTLWGLGSSSADTVLVWHDESLVSISSTA